MRGYLQKRAPGTWTATVDLPRGSDGKRRQKRVSIRGTRRQAEAELARIVHELETGTYVAAEKITVAQFLDRWLEAQKPRLEARTHSSYSTIVKHRLKPALGSMQLKRLRPLNVQEALASWLAGPRADDKAGHPSKRTVHHAFVVLKAALAQAVRWDLLHRNPCDSVDPPRPDRTEMVALDVAAAARLVAAADGTDLLAPIVVTLGTALRRGELLGLKWGDVDLEAGTLAVRRSLEQRAGVLRTKEPKTDRSRRTISLPAFVVEKLRRHRVEQAQRFLALGLGRPGVEAFVFDRLGQPWSPDLFSQQFYHLVRRSKLPKVRFHDLRHTAATQLLRAGVDLKTVSTALGHSTISTTADIYLHAVEALKQDAAARLDNALGPALAERERTGNAGA